MNYISRTINPPLKRASSTESKKKKIISGYIDKVLVQVVSDSHRCKVFYYGKRQHGIFHRLKKDESCSFLTEI